MEKLLRFNPCYYHLPCNKDYPPLLSFLASFEVVVWDTGCSIRKPQKPHQSTQSTVPLWPFLVHFVCPCTTLSAKPVPCHKNEVHALLTVLRGSLQCSIAASSQVTWLFPGPPPFPLSLRYDLSDTSTSSRLGPAFPPSLWPSWLTLLVGFLWPGRSNALRTCM